MTTTNDALHVLSGMLMVILYCRMVFAGARVYLPGSVFIDGSTLLCRPNGAWHATQALDMQGTHWQIPIWWTRVFFQMWIVVELAGLSIQSGMFDLMCKKSRASARLFADMYTGRRVCVC